MALEKDNETDFGPSGKNYLLTIAIDKYEYDDELFNCVRDAKKLVEVLQDRYGFEKDDIWELYDEEAQLKGIYEKLEGLMEKVTPEDNLVIYFSGHGYYHKPTKTGHLIPYGVRGWYHFFSNANLKDLIRGINSFHTFLIVDCCFSGSLFVEHKEGGNQGPDFSSLAAKVGVWPSRWALAAGRIEKVEDGRHGGHSPFARALLEYLKRNKQPKVPISELIQYVRKVTSRNATQTPVGGVLFGLGDLGGEFVLKLKERKPLLSVTDVEKDYPVALVAGGGFMMGSHDSDYETPHDVMLSDFEMGNYLVTFSLFDDFCFDTKRALPPDGGWGRKKKPVINVNWYDAIEFANWLSEKEGLEQVYSLERTADGIKVASVRWHASGYRLPTEAEWEYAARGGKLRKGEIFSGSDQLEEVAWYTNNSEGRTHPVGGKKPNALGMYDLSGNVWEWCWDWYSIDYYKRSGLSNPKGPETGEKLNFKVARGGSYLDDEKSSRVASRFGGSPREGWPNIGFRLAKTVATSI